jgi:hypothetical protein
LSKPRVEIGPGARFRFTPDYLAQQGGAIAAITGKQRALLHTAGKRTPGELLTMGDGSQWFHPFSGAAPVKITDHNRADLTTD